MIVGLLIALLVVVLDQVSKIAVYSYLLEVGKAVEVTSFFNLVSAWNTGVSFSMFSNLGVNGVFILSAFSLCVVVFLVYWLNKEKSLYMRVSLGFVIGGAIGNVIDRVRLGAVYDFLDVHVGAHHWPAFNVADSFICIGAVLIVLDGIIFDRCGLNKKTEEIK